MRYVYAFAVAVFCLAMIARAGPPYVAPATGPAPLEESDKDNLNVWENVPEYAFATDAKARVLISAEPKTFMVVWAPPGYAKITSTPSRIRHSTTASEPFISRPISAWGNAAGEVVSFFMAMSSG